ncbi:MAG: carboxylesterase family protein [Oscillospiraceae bacterium]|nr:carboxylesterase family protein [Oscillospiraceae bacterium]
MNTLVNTVFGQVEGFRGDGFTCFLGVPYARKPLGDLRFRAPQMVEPWEGVLEAKGYPKDPMQANAVFGPEYYSEDCLYLNIWVPDHAGENAPVMLWIPGGAFANGGSGALSPEGPTSYDCALLARDTGCIMVSMSYRLNVFGFLNLNYLSDRFDDHVGMKDIIMSMKWVRETIASFGGDPDNVTLFGESAGGEAITTLMMIDEAQPYYRRAIIESNCFASYYTVEEEKEICELYLSYVGLDKDHVDDLVNVSYEQHIEAGRKLDAYVSEHYTGRCSFCPVVDGTFIKDFPTLADYTGFDKEVLIGSNYSEGNFQMMYLWNDADKYAPCLLRRLDEDKQKQVMGYYDLPDKQAFGEMLTDVMYAVPKLWFAERVSRSGAPVYLFRYDYYTKIQEQLGLYCCHVSELLPLFEIKTKPFGSLYAGNEAEIRTIGTRMRRRWGAFARTGCPDVEGCPQWKPYTEQERNTLVINLEDHPVVDAEAKIRERYAGFDRLLL